MVLDKVRYRCCRRLIGILVNFAFQSVDFYDNSFYLISFCYIFDSLSEDGGT